MHYETEIVPGPSGPDGVGSLVCARAQSLGAFLIAMASHGKSALQKLFIGSVTAYVVAHSPVPVLVLPPAHLVGRAADAAQP